MTTKDKWIVNNMTDVQLNLFGSGDEIAMSPIETLRNRESHHPLSPVVVSYGGGKNSTAMLILMASMNIPVNLILFADTGGEAPETYEFIEVFRKWLIGHGMPDITVVRANPRPVSLVRKSAVNSKKNFMFLTRYCGKFSTSAIAYALLWVSVTHHSATTLEEYCLSAEMLPSKSYGKSACSIQWKIDPQEEFVTKWLLENGLCGMRKKGRGYEWDYPVRKIIGLHFGETHRLIDRATKTMRNLNDGIYRNEYPLMTYGIDEQMCVRIIEGAGLSVPPKSSCFFCPNKKPSEIASMSPELVERALMIEACAARGTHHREDTSVKGLGRSFAWADLNQITELEKIGMEFRSDSRSCQCLD